ncbi:MAG: GNAT family N-acetyltransferase [Chlamydiales bacterium]|nr:GNAT family N-acetyltransferase [Chlamydiales bacterium]
MRLLLLQDNTEKKPEYDAMSKKYITEQDSTFIDTSSQVFLIEHESDIIGFIASLLEDECFPDEDLPEICLKITAFYIEPEWRKQNLGSQAFKLVRQWGRENKAALIELEVAHDCNPEFLQKEGLEFVGSGKKEVFRGFI